MKIEAGKYYRTRDGRLAFVAAVGSPFGCDEGCRAIGWTRNDFGSLEAAWYPNGWAMKFEPSYSDLVAEVPTEEAAIEQQTEATKD